MKLLRHLASTLLLACLPLAAAAQANGFPDKPIRIVVPFPRAVPPMRRRAWSP